VRNIKSSHFAPARQGGKRAGGRHTDKVEEAIQYGEGRTGRGILIDGRGKLILGEGKNTDAEQGIGGGSPMYNGAGALGELANGLFCRKEQGKR